LNIAQRLKLSSRAQRPGFFLRAGLARRAAQSTDLLMARVLRRSHEALRQGAALAVPSVLGENGFSR
jgi:hypothetical protein